MKNPEPGFRERALELVKAIDALNAKADALETETYKDALRRAEQPPMEKKEAEVVANIGSACVRRSIDNLQNAARELRNFVSFRQQYDHELQ